MNFKFHYFLIAFVFCFTASYLLLAKNAFADADGVILTVTISASSCGNGGIDSGEECDGSDLDGGSCVSRGYSSGTLSCNSNCTFNVSSCSSSSQQQQQQGGGGGGGGIVIPPSGTGSVVFSGRAYPLSTVTLLKDAQVAVSTIAGPDSNFKISLSGLSAGSYIFSLYSQDKNGLRSVLFNFSITLTVNATTNVCGIFIAPTIAVNKSEVKKGDDISIFGQTAPQSEVTILVNSKDDYFVKTKSDKDGVYLYNFDTSPLDFGDHSAKSKAAISDFASSFSNLILFKIGAENVLAPKPTEKKVLKGEINGDDRVNLVDFSIVAYWYKRPSPPLKVDLNGDGKVDLIDFSIMAYYWTG